MQKVYYRRGGLWPDDLFISVFYNYLWVSLAKIFRTKVILYGIEVTKVRRKKTIILWKKLLRKLDWVNTRTRESLNVFANMADVDKRNSFFYSPDVTFALKDQDLLKYNRKPQCNEFKDDFIIWALGMPWTAEERSEEHFQKRYRVFIKAMVEVHRHLDMVFPTCRNILVPFSKPKDVTLAEDLISSGFDNVEVFGGEMTEIRPLFSKAQFAICMRFHSVIFSMYERCPFVAISYSPKTTDTLQDNGMNNFTEFGIRDSAYFYKEFDLNKDELLRLIDVERSEIEAEHIEKIFFSAKENEARLILWLNG